MSLPWFATLTVYVKVYPRVYDHGGHIIDYGGTPTRRAITGCSFQPQGMRPGTGAGEIDVHREATLESGHLYVPGGTEIDGTAIIEMDGLDYQVVGEPADWSIGTPLPYKILVLTRWEG